MKPGDLVRVIDKRVPSPIEVGDLAFLTEVDWDERDKPNGIVDQCGEVITGRGYFFFPDKPHVNIMFERGEKHLGVMLLFERVEVINEAG